MTMEKGVNLKDTTKSLKNKIDSTSLYTCDIVSEGKTIKISIEA